MFDLQSLTLFGLVVLLLHVLGVLTAVYAITKSKTSQGAIAWAIMLVMFPYVTLPLYWIFGRNKFQGYVRARRSDDKDIRHVIERLQEYRSVFRGTLSDDRCGLRVLERLAKMPFTRHNRVGLRIDGEATFSAIFAAIDAAAEYVVVQYFIVKDDQLGRQLQEKLIAKANDGVRVYFLYDEVGCYKLSKAYIREMTDAGIEVRPFQTTKGWGNRFQLNFRNHRKIVIVDGRTAFVGGLNVGDEYMGRDPKIGPWRDTHMELAGPSVQCVQLAFLEDWYWATHEVPELNWDPEAADGGDQEVLVLPSGPADPFETCGLFFVHAIHSARHRVWIASPYFVPDAQVIAALQLAALRGVDVRVMLPEKPDHVLVYLSAFSFIEETEPAGVKIYRYQPGFLHQKVILVDDEFAAVGTANLDNRSFRLNFEITIALADALFAAEVRTMLDEDFANCRLVKSEDLTNRSFWFRLAVSVSRLMAPIQ